MKKLIHQKFNKTFIILTSLMFLSGCTTDANNMIRGILQINNMIFVALVVIAILLVCIIFIMNPENYKYEKFMMNIHKSINDALLENNKFLFELYEMIIEDQNLFKESDKATPPPPENSDKATPPPPENSDKVTPPPPENIEQSLESSNDNEMPPV